MRRATLIVNPYASAVTEERVHAVERELSSAYELTTILTQQRGHAIDLARAAEGDAIFACGGDGVFNEVLNGADGTRPLGFVPGGGTNVLPRALGLPEDAVGAARRLVQGKERRISLGRANGRRFGFSAGIGLDSEAVRRIDRMGRRQDHRRPGDLAFFRAIVATVASAGWRLPDRLEIADQGPAALIIVSNDAVFTYGASLALRFCPEARFELGLDYAALPHPGPARIVHGFVRASIGRGLAGLPGALSGHDVDRIEVACHEPSPLQVDGEDLGDVTEAIFEAERNAVTVLV